MAPKSTPTRPRRASGSTGLGVDASGGPVIDPTENVLAVIESAVKRQDDLREAEMRRVNQIEALRAEYQEKLALAEAKRIDAIRAVDVAAVDVAAVVLANEVAENDSVRHRGQQPIAAIRSRW